MRVLRFLSRAALCAALSSLSSCGGSADPSVGLRVDWGLTDPAADLPAGLSLIRVITWIGDETEPRGDSRFTVMNLMDRDGDTNREICPLSDDCTNDGLPPGEEVRITIEGLDAGGRTSHVGHAGPFVLQHGERRYVDLRMYGANAVTPLTEAPMTARFFHTATALPDGRILFTGGFTSARAGICPASLPAGSHCFDLTAADDAYVLDPASGRIRELTQGMLRARGGHTATILPDGNVLLAGGAERAQLTLVPQTGGFSIGLTVSAGGDTYEIFAPQANAETEDFDGDGDPTRGRFLGAAENETIPGRLGTVHVLHAATLLPGGDGRVILAGGVGAPDTFTVFDLLRAGGYGVVGSGSMGSARPAPSAITFGTGTSERAWIVGGAIAASNDDLAEVWRAGTGSDRVGTTEVPTGFPGGGGVDRPGFSLWRPNVELVGDGAFALVTGWLGPFCEDGSSTPVYSPAAPVLCPFDMSGNRSYTVSAATGAATPTMGRNGHALGASARLGDGRVVVTGGFDSLALVARNTADLFTGDVSMGAATISADRPPMGMARALHTTTALPDDTAEGTPPMLLRRGGYVSFGGITVAADGSSVTVLSALEVVYLR